MNFKSFLLLYALYLAPILTALGYEYFVNPIQKAPTRLPLVIPNLGTASAWLMLISFIYLANNAILHYFNFAVRPKHLAQHREDLFRLAQMHLPVLVVGRVGVRLDLSFAAMCLFYAAYYAVLFEAGKQFDIVATPQSLRANPFALCIVVLTAVVVVWTLHFHRDSFETAAWVCALHAILYFAPAFLHPSRLSSSIHGHAHHWWWSYPAAFMATLDHPISTIASAMFITCHLHGAATFGFDPVFNVEKRGVFIGENKIGGTKKSKT